MFNQISRFNSLRAARESDSLYCGKDRLAIKGYGDVRIRVRDLRGQTQVLTLHNAAYVPEMQTNLASFKILRALGFWWDTRTEPTTLRRPDDVAIAILDEIHDQFVLKHLEGPHDRATFFIRRNKLNS